eukprot:1187852-Prorocentrum_minimum.AAC.6
MIAGGVGWPLTSQVGPLQSAVQMQDPSAASSPLRPQGPAHASSVYRPTESAPPPDRVAANPLNPPDDDAADDDNDDDEEEAEAEEEEEAAYMFRGLERGSLERAEGTAVAADVEGEALPSAGEGGGVDLYWYGTTRRRGGGVVSGAEGGGVATLKASVGLVRLFSSATDWCLDWVRLLLSVDGLGVDLALNGEAERAALRAGLRAWTGGLDSGESAEQGMGQEVGHVSCEQVLGEAVGREGLRIVQAAVALASVVTEVAVAYLHREV